jgi:xylan 1,4-beta-xylosidase
MPEFTNPVIPGFHPDPSVCRVGDDYYLVVSSFAFLPGVPVFHSRNLVDWEPIGHVFDRPGVVDLTGIEVSDGIWAPTIRHHEGLFYLVTTIARARQGAVTLLATASDPAGPWSDPVVLDAEGIDPSLFFDADGRCWFTACRDAAEPAVTGPAELWLRELDLVGLALVGPSHVLWHGAQRGSWVEAPHLYRRDGAYFLLAAEGGTEGNHAVTAARAESVTGPYRGDPRNPLLTHRHLSAGTPIQNVGHADLVETAAGQTWAVVLGTRPMSGFHTLGREVFLVPVEWTAAGPVFAPGTGQVRAIETRPLVGTGPADRAGGVSEPGAGTPEWLGLRALPPVAGPAGEVVLPLRPDTLAGTGRPAFLGRRQAHPEFMASVLVDFDPARAGEEAGLAVHQGSTGYVTATVQRLDGQRSIALTVVAGVATTREQRILPVAGPVRIFVSGVGLDYRVEYLPGPDTERRLLGAVDGRILSTERAGGFVGVVLGPYATSNGRATTAAATFTEFSYTGLSARVARCWRAR